MPDSLSSMITELALRAATNTSSRDLKDATTQAESIKDAAVERAKGMMGSESNGLPLPHFSNVQEEAIGLAVTGVAVAYKAISAQVAVLKDKRLCFDKEREAGIATFLIPYNKEATDLSTEEQVMKDFLELAMGNPVFSKYLGIHSADLPEPKGKFYSVLPFYRMSEMLAQPVASTKPLDRQRTAINLFFRSAMPDAIADIDNDFQNDWKLVSFWKSIFQRKNYLNDLRGPRFIMMCLSNLLWNLQHPVDPATGFPLSLAQSIEICRSVELFLNQLLDEKGHPYLEKICNIENGLMSYMRKLEVYTKGLRVAYVHEQLHELNFDEITHSAHRALRIMDKSVFMLVYKKRNPIANKYEPDDKAAETLADSISYFNQLLCDNVNLIAKLGPVPTWIPKEAGINTPPRTIIDVLIIVSHLSSRERDRLLANLAKSIIPSEIEFYQSLIKFNQKFIKPIKAVNKEELKVTTFSPKHMEVGKLTARRLMPFISLVIEDYRLDVDIPNTSVEKNPQGKTDLPTKLTGKQQVQEINIQAQQGNKASSYYFWELSPFTKGTAALDNLPKCQYRMTQVSQLMDNVKELVENYRGFLLKKEFQAFLLQCLKKVSEEIAVLEDRVDEADRCLDHSERVNRGLMAILRPLTTNMDRSLEEFRRAMVDFKKVVSAPDFTVKQQLVLNTKISAVAEQYKALFIEDSGLAVLLEAMGAAQEPNPQPPIDVEPPVEPLKKETHAMSRDVVLSSKVVDAGEVMALRGVVQKCYDALSFQSKIDRKGLLLRELLETLERRKNFNKEQISYVVMELVRVTASERPTWFFQASYGQTRSAKALIAAIKDPKINGMLSLASIILGRPNVDLAKIDDDQIINRFKSFRAGQRLWQEPVGQMRLRNFPESSTRIAL